MTSLSELRAGIGDRLDEGLSGFDIQSSEFVALNTLYQFADLPRAVYYWSLEPHYERVVDVKTTKDYDEMTAHSQELIPHKVLIQIKVMSSEILEAEEMATAVLEEFGRAPCIEGVSFYYEGFSNATDEFNTGLFARTFEYSGWIWLNGRSETNPLVQNIDLQIGLTADEDELAERLAEEEEEDPNPKPDIPDDAVAITEILWDLITS